MLEDFAAIDFETANRKLTSICAVGVVVVRGGELCDSYYHLVRPEPEYYIRQFTAIHGISYEDTMSEPNFAYVWEELREKIDNLPLVAHNKAFDENVLRATCRMYGIDMPDVPFYCTLQQARRVIPRGSIENYRLPTVCAYLGVPLETSQCSRRCRGVRAYCTIYFLIFSADAEFSFYIGYYEATGGFCQL